MSWLQNLHRFRPRLLDATQGYTRQKLISDLAAGLTVGVVALPLAMAFAIASGVKPEQGIFTAIVGGFLVSALGGSNVQIGGPAGAFIVIVYGILTRYGLANLLVATMLAGLVLILMGSLKLGALVRYVPVSIVIGFTNGIAVLIALSQLKDWLGLRLGPLPADFFSQAGAVLTHLDGINGWALTLGTSATAIMFIWPRLWGQNSPLPAAMLERRTLRSAGRVPASIVALILLTVLATSGHWPVETIGSRFGGVPQSLPSLSWPAVNWASVQNLITPTLTIAMLGAIESLLCARIADNLIDAPRHDPNQELIAQGVANLVVPFFGGIPVTGTIARTVTNVRAGAQTPVAGMVHAVTLLGVVLVAAPLAGHVPLAVLAGILLFVAWNMGEWHEFARLRRFSPQYSTILVGTFVLTVVFDLTVAVEVGLVLACLFFIYRMSQLFRAAPSPGDAAPPGVHVIHLYGSLFFGAVGKVEGLDSQLPPGTRLVVLETAQLVSMDTSGVDALAQLKRQLARRGVRLALVGLNKQPRSLVRRSGFEQVLGTDHVLNDLSEAFALLDAPAA